MWPFKRRKSGGEALRDFPPLQRKRIGLLLFNVRDSALEEVQPRLALLCGELVRRGYVIMSLTSSIGMATIDDGTDDLEMTADALVGAMRTTVRIVYGRCECLEGCIGSSSAFTYGAIVPNFSQVLSTLLSAEFGTVTRIESATAQ